MLNLNRKALTRGRRRAAISAAVFAAAPLLANQFANAVGTESYTGLAGGDIGLNTNYAPSTAISGTQVLVYNKGSLTTLANGSPITALALNFDTNVGALTIGTNASSGITLANAGSINILSSITGSSFADTVASPLTLTPASTTTAGVASFTNGSATSSIVLDITGPISVGATTNNEVLDLAGANTGNNTVSGAITGPTGGTLTINKISTGAGQWIDSATNTFSGSVLVAAGTLNLTGIDTVTGFSTVSAGTFGMGGTTSFSATSALSGTGFDSATGTTTLAGITVSGGTFSSTGTTSFGTLNFSNGTISAAGVSTFGAAASIGTMSGGLLNATGTSTFLGTFNQSGGTLSSTGTTSFGTINFSNGTISAAGISTFGAAASIGTISGGLFNATGTTTFLGTLAFSGGTLSSTGTTTFGTITQTGGTLSLGAAGISTFSGSLTDSAGTFLAAGTINGAGGITVSGTGYATISGTNGWTGPITINAGTVSISGSDTAAGNVSVTGNASVFPNLVLNYAGAAILDSAKGLILGNGTLTLAGTPVTAGQGVASIALNGSTSSYLELGSSTLSVGSATIGRTGGNSFFVDESGGGTLKLATTTATLLPYMLVQDASGTGFGTVSTTGIVTRYLSSQATTLVSATGNSGTNYITSGTFGTSGTVATNSLWANTLTQAGTLNLGGGSLTLTGLAVLDAGSNPYTIQNGTLGANNSEVIFHQLSSGLETVSATVSGGTGYITKDGSGALLVSSTNSYTGGTIINAGTLMAGSSTNLVAHNGPFGSGTNNITINSGATLDVDGHLVGVVTPSGYGTVTNSGGALGTFSAYNGVAEGAGGASSLYLTDGAGSLAVVYNQENAASGDQVNGSNSYSGGTTLSNGNLGFGSFNAVRMANDSGFGTGTIYFNNGGVDLTGVAGATLPNNISVSTPYNIVDNDSYLTLSGSITGTSAGAILFYGNGSTTFTGNASNFPGTIEYENSGTRGTGVSAFVLGSSSALNLSQATVALASQTYFGTASNAALEYGSTGSGTVLLGALKAGSLTGGTAGNLASGTATAGFAGIVNNITANSTAIFKIGALNTNSNYNGTIVDNDWSNNNTVVAGALTGIDKNGTGVLVLNGANAYSGPTIVEGGVLLENGSFSANADAGTTIASSYTVGTMSSVAGLSLGELVSGPSIHPGTLITAIGTGTIGISIAPSSAGAATFSVVSSSLPTTTNLILNGGVLGLGNYGNFTRGIGTLGTQVQFGTFGGGFAAYTADRTVNLGGAAAQMTFGTGSFLPSTAPLIFGDATATNSIQFSNPLDLGAANQTVNVIRGQSTLGSGSFDASLNGALSDGGLIKSGNGVLNLGVSNAYSGGTTINAGTLTDTSTGVAGAFGTGSISVSPTGTTAAASAALVSNTDTSIAPTASVVVNNNVSAIGTLYFNSPTPTIGDLSGSGNIVLNSTGGTSLVTGDTKTTTFSGVISDGSATGYLTVAGSGTFTLAGPNTYRAGTTLSSGTLFVTNTSGSGTGSGPVAVNGGTFGGTGTASGTVNLSSATLEAGIGAANGTLTTGAANFSGGTFSVAIDSDTSSSDMLSSTGAVALGTTTLLNVTDLGSTTITNPTTFVILATASGVTGNFASLPDGATVTVGPNSYTINYGTDPGFSNDVTLTVPEPASLGLLSLAGTMMLRRRRRMPRTAR